MFQKPMAVVFAASVLATSVCIAVATVLPPEAQAPPNSAAVAEKPVPLDQFAGKTVKNVAMGLEVMRQRESNCPQIGDLAPDFELLRKAGESTLRLADMRGGKPVVLIFGSYT